MSKPFLLLSARHDEAIARVEIGEFRRFLGVGPRALVRARMERGEMPRVDFADWAGVIVGGSSYDVSTPEARKSDNQLAVERYLGDVCSRAIEADFPLLGICYGLGVLARLCGARVDGSHPEQIAAPRERATPAGLADPLLAGLPAGFQGYVGHHESVAAPASGMTLLVTNDVSPVQLVRIGRNVYGSQFHPEISRSGMMLRIARTEGIYYPAPRRTRIEQACAGAHVGPVHRVLANFAGRGAGASAHEDGEVPAPLGA